MSETDVIDDFIVLSVPPSLSLDNAGVIEQLDRLADVQIVAQYRRRRPKAILLQESQWLITSDWREVERFQPAHDCATCRAGNDQAIAFLKEHPDQRLALGNLHYVEVW